MTGKDLIIYILTNDLENEPVFKDGTILGLSTVEEAAVKLGVGIQTIYIWIERGLLDYTQIGGVYFIPVNCEQPARKE